MHQRMLLNRRLRTEPRNLHAHTIYGTCPQPQHHLSCNEFSPNVQLNIGQGSVLTNFPRYSALNHSAVRIVHASSCSSGRLTRPQTICSKCAISPCPHSLCLTYDRAWYVQRKLGIVSRRSLLIDCPNLCSLDGGPDSPCSHQICPPKQPL